MLAHLLNKKWVILLLANSTLLLTGCATVPDAIKGTTATPVLQLSTVQHSPKQFIGAEARFGGTVVAVTNKRDHTLLEIATVVLDNAARPVLGEPSQGRVLASVSGFLEPIDFNGQLVTVVGPITGLQEGKIGMIPYQFVTLNVTAFKRWRLAQQVIMPPQPMGPWDWHHGRWGPGWGPSWHNPGPAQVRTFVTE